MYECDVWDFPPLLCGLRFRGNWLERQEFYNRALSRHRLILGQNLRGLEKVRKPDDLYRVFSQGKLRGEKSPFYCARLLRLARLYPGCSFILLWRDPVEINRSVVRASYRSLFFRRRGMVSRLIRYQELMIKQAAQLEKAGARVHHVTYDALIDQTEQACRAICKFLGLEFDPQMLDLSQADFSTIYAGDHHDHLRRRKIERTRFTEPAIDQRVTRKMGRFQRRWDRLTQQWLCDRKTPSDAPEPSLAELLYHKAAGAFFHSWDEIRRAVFEFLPLPWLRTYRQVKKWRTARRAALAAVEQVSIWQQWRSHAITIVTGCLLLLGVATLDSFSDPHATLAPLYLLPSALVTLVVSRRWGTPIAAASSVVWTVVQSVEDPLYGSYFLIVWNSLMRFVFIQFVVLLLDRIRVESSFASDAGLQNADVHDCTASK